MVIVMAWNETFRPNTWMHTWHMLSGMNRTFSSVADQQSCWLLILTTRPKNVNSSQVRWGFLPDGLGSIEGQETGAITPAPENASKKI
jgi:hypothetical protein